MRKYIRTLISTALIGIALIGFTATANASNSGLSLSWTCLSNCSDSSDTATLLQQSPDSTNWTLIATLATNVFSYNISNLVDRTTYCYRVASYNPYGTGDWSNVTCKTTTGRPLKVFNLSWLNPAWLVVALAGLIAGRQVRRGQRADEVS